VVVLAVIAVAVLLPESRSAERPRIDVVGVIVVQRGLAALTYGLSRRARTAGPTPGARHHRRGGGGAGRAGGLERWLTGRNRAGSGGSLAGA